MYRQIDMSMYRAMPLESISLKLDTVFNIFILSLSCAYLVHAGQRHCAKFQPSKDNSRQQEKSGKNNNSHRLFAKGGSNSKVSEQKPFINSWTLPEAKSLCLLGALLRCPLGYLHLTFLWEV